MKTFDEAVKIVVDQQQDLLTANFNDGIDHISNECFAKVIAILASRLLIKIKIKEEEHPMTSVCRHLHSAFELGLLVGMEMEKER